jgi:hypothetical protein
MRPLKPSSQIVVATDGEERILHLAAGAKAINAFNDLIRQYDPDLILSECGDSVLFPISERSNTSFALITKRLLVLLSQPYICSTTQIGYMFVGWQHNCCAGAADPMFY